MSASLAPGPGSGRNAFYALPAAPGKGIDRGSMHTASPEAWDAIAEGDDRHVAPTEADLAGEALDLAGLRKGERFLDVAAGTGGLGLPAARRGAEVLATDWSPAMIARFTARARAEGLENAVHIGAGTKPM
jgi:cyclopropane fatty-acyl-phospholipid synthase-like methyltransferase